MEENGASGRGKLFHRFVPALAGRAADKALKKGEKFQCTSIERYLHPFRTDIVGGFVA